MTNTTYVEESGTATHYYEVWGYYNTILNIANITIYCEAKSNISYATVGYKLPTYLRPLYNVSFKANVGTVFGFISLNSTNGDIQFGVVSGTMTSGSDITCVATYITQ